jgi:hypothetical protein
VHKFDKIHDLRYRVKADNVPHLQIGDDTLAVMSGAHTLMSNVPARATCVGADNIAPHGPETIVSGVFKEHGLFAVDVGVACR